MCFIRIQTNVDLDQFGPDIVEILRDTMRRKTTKQEIQANVSTLFHGCLRKPIEVKPGFAFVFSLKVVYSHALKLDGERNPCEM